MLEIFFMDEELKLLFAENGFEALEIIRDNKVDLIITDLIMPKQEGLGLIFNIKKTHPTMKIIAISGGGRGSAENYLNLSKTLGADMTFIKPFEKKQIIDAVNKLLNITPA